MRGPYLAAIAVAAAFSVFPATAAAELRFRPCGPDRCARLSVPLDHSVGALGAGRVAGRRVRATVPIPSALYGAYAGETGGGSTRAGVVAALFRR